MLLRSIAIAVTGFTIGARAFDITDLYFWQPDSSTALPTDSASLSAFLATYSVTATGVNLYAPYHTTCPESGVREAVEINDDEKEYVASRHEKTNESLKSFLERANMSNFDPKSFIDDNSKDHNISIGIAFSGGGYRAMLNGAGQMLGLDGRYEEANDKGLGGLLQSSTYLAGLSGGNWLVGSVVLNNFISINDILNGTIDIWDLTDSIFYPTTVNLYKAVKYYYLITSAIDAKKDAGFDTSITDIWGRALSYQFFDDGSSGLNLTWSKITGLSSFMDFEMPFPIVVADGRTPGEFIINQNSTVFEISPYELGSWDPSLKAFTPTKYLGSSYNNGSPNGSCYANFDNGGFIMGTSSSLFNQIILQINGYDVPSIIKSLVEKLLSIVSTAEDDIAAYEPNPFLHSEFGASERIVTNDTLYLVDGGEDGQNVPLYPLIQTSRKLDIIFAFDNSADTSENWANGTSLVKTYQRQYYPQGKGTPFPYVPSVDEFWNQGLNERPVFFGCDAKNLTTLVEYHNSTVNETDIPLLVWFSNHRISQNSNTSTFKMSYENDERDALIQNGFEVASRANLTEDSEWLTCVGCAIIRRQQERTGEAQTEECQKCFAKYCWQGDAKDAAASSVTLAAVTSAASSSALRLGSSSSSSSKKNSADFISSKSLLFYLVNAVLLLVI
ncbi:Lysophospholipase 1 [Scheffersomyces spartinae]|uniref:Lysophospholipase n=1 Tax=Scheffersomyces spartinae TaxID=45513 RepID=A0A9P8AIT2_9ASCO|nr:Lysophospholipase 1 [Scheffersomyces spartinae]KAG7193456.1 Lysophospholipase 1 [Scheffersomyces spartinae]